MNLKDRILAFLSAEPKQEEVEKLASELALDNGTIIVSEDFAEGSAIFIKSQEEGEEDVALPVGEYTLEDGRMLIVEVEGEIKSISEKESEEESEMESEEEAKEEEMAYEEDKMEEDEEEEKEEETKMEDYDTVMEMIKTLESRIAALEAPQQEMEEVIEEEVAMSKEEVVEETVELSAEEVAEAEPVVHSPEVELDNGPKLSFPKSNNMTTRDVVFSKFFNK